MAISGDEGDVVKSASVAGVDSASITVRRLGPGDEEVVALLAADAEDFGMSDEGKPLDALAPDDAAAYLANDHVVHWVAFDGGRPVGTLVAHELPLPVVPGRELLLYEIGVREAYRRAGVGSRLMRALEDWAHERGLESIWVLADNPEAEAFYHRFGFEPEVPAPTYLLRTRSASTRT